MKLGNKQIILIDSDNIKLDITFNFLRYKGLLNVNLLGWYIDFNKPRMTGPIEIPGNLTLQFSILDIGFCSKYYWRF